MGDHLFHFVLGSVLLAVGLFSKSESARTEAPVLSSQTG
jgi:hypothetical protein